MKLLLIISKTREFCGSSSPDYHWACTLKASHRGDCYNHSAARSWCGSCLTWKEAPHA